MDQTTNLTSSAPARWPVPALPAWVLERARDAELASGHPVLAALLGAHPARRGLVCAILALKGWLAIAERLAAAGGAAEAGALFRMPGRRLLRQVLGPVPGLPGALARIGETPLPRAEDYGLLLGILTGGSRRRRQVLAHLAPVGADAIRAIAILDEAFLSVGVTERILCGISAENANSALAFLRRRYSLAGTPAGEQVLRARCRNLGHDTESWVKNTLRDIGDDFPRGPLPDGPGIRQIVRGSEFRHLGRAWNNCLPSYVLSAANGRNAFYLVTASSPAVPGGQIQAILELSRHRLGGRPLWTLESVTWPDDAPYEGILPAGITRLLARHGVQRLEKDQAPDAWETLDEWAMSRMPWKNWFEEAEDACVEAPDLVA